ncbi:MAG: hypothetical protein IJF03_04145 [Lachnospiraceae bacterium]|nr:hypothetical protein [Lachnospiraceae bacterium]
MAKRAARSRNSRQERNMYVYGNTVRRLEVVPELEPRKEQPERTGQRISKNAIRKNREKARHMNSAYVVFLSVACVVTFIVCFQYIQLRSEITERMENIAELESQLSDLKIENDAEYSRATSSIDLEEMKRIAMEELGMVYADKEQVVIYEDKEAEYFRQYEDIPNN